MQQNTKTDHYEVLIAGFGPSGAVAAGMLGKLGHSTLVVDRLKDIYDKPRAIAVDHEILRHFDNMGIADAVMPHIAPFTASQHFGAKGQLIRRIDMVPQPYPLGYTPSMVFTQPPVEAALRAHAQSFDCVDIELGVELTGLTQTPEGVTAELRDGKGNRRMVTADYAIGCDGASSTVRQAAGIQLEDLVFDEPWLVIDVLVDEGSLEKLPQTSAQFCDPARPTSFIIGPHNHRRWEIMLLPGENPREMEKADNVWKLLSRWITPQDGTLWRAAAYRFHALVADKWRRGRILIAGDAAHQQPPFIGQGMCQGLRDVSNLVWKLDRVLRKQSPDSLLDSYGTERKRHVKTLTGKIKAIGEMICIRDPVRASQRDEQVLAEGGGQPRTITRQEIVPPLEEGLLADTNAPARGTLFPQPVIRQPTGDLLLDKLVPAGWRLFIDGRSRLAAADFTAEAKELGLAVATIVPPGQSPGDAGFLEETQGVMAAWFDRHASTAVLVRPDHYVFGAARSAAELKDQIAGLKRALG